MPEINEVLARIARIEMILEDLKRSAVLFRYTESVNNLDRFKLASANLLELLPARADQDDLR